MKYVPRVYSCSVERKDLRPVVPRREVLRRRDSSGHWVPGAALWGFMVLLGNITQAAVTARACPEGTLGRVTAMRRTLTRGSVPLATLAGGALGATLGVGWALAGWQVLAVVSLAAVAPAARRVDAGRDDVD